MPNDESRAFSIRSRSLDVTEGWLFAPQRILIIVVVGTDETRGESRDADETHREKTKEEERGRKGGKEGKRERDDRAAGVIRRDVRRLDGPESVPLGDAVSLLARSRYIPTGSAGMFDFVCEKGEKEGTMA